MNTNIHNKMDDARDGTFCVLSIGNVLLRSGGRSKTLERDRDGVAVGEFLESVRNKSTSQIRETVKSYFD